MVKKILMLCAALILCLGAALACAEEGVLDLHDRSFASLSELAAELDAHADMATVDLTGVKLSLSDRKTLLKNYPDVHFLWKMSLWGVEVSSEDTEATFPGNEWIKPAELCDLLDVMPNLKSVYMYDKRIKLSELAMLFDGYPDVFFGLTIKINEAHSVRTDWTAYSTLGRQPQVGKLQMKYFTYMKNLKALDVGHMTIHSLEFLLKSAPLKILIVADCSLTDISPIAAQTELEYVELFKNYITDISPLAALTNLRDLNIGYNQITDLSPLYDLPNLERVWVMGNWFLPEEEMERFREHQPDVEFVTFSYGATGNRMDKNQKQFPGTSWRHHKHYDTIYWIFHNNQYIDWDVPVPQIKTIDDP